jgi:ppGpp synthetase/RelA/SpoT-type nucleotidyltranferase
MEPAVLATHVARFSWMQPSLHSSAEALQRSIRRLVSPVANVTVTCRVKEVASFAEKILRKNKYADPTRDITDLIGVRIVTQLASEADRVAELLREKFTLDERNCVNKARELRSGEFGYLSHHLVLVINEWSVPGLRNDQGILPIRVEVQVRTILQHAWAAIGHDRIYKSGFRVPDRWQREAARIAALLESADADFVSLVEAVESYRGEHGVYLKPDAIRAELALAEQIQKHARYSPELMERRVRLALSLGDWTQARSIIEENTHVETRTAALWCCLGLALCGAGGGPCEEGVAAFRTALDTDPTNTEARLLLARALEEKSPAEARDHFAAVLRLRPRDHRALAGSLRIAARQQGEQLDLQPWTLLAAEARRGCDRLIEVGVNLVEALRLRAVFLLVDDTSLADEGLAAVAEAILVCRNMHEIRDLESGFQALRVIRRQRPAIEAAYRMIRLAQIAHHNDPDARAELDLWAGAFRPITGPVWALTGTFGLESAKGKGVCRPLVVGALKGLEGTVIPGANRDEVGGLLKEANAGASGPLVLHGNGPAGTAPTSSSTGFVTVWDTPLRIWVDLLRSGIPPAEVRLLCVNGDPFAAFECRLAAALGARVAVIPDSGGCAADLDSAAARRFFPGVLRLPRDPLAVRLFLHRAGPGLELSPEQIEGLARLAHEEYLRHPARSSEPSRAPWPDLKDNLKESNREQVRRSKEVLSAAGFEMRHMTSGGRIREFSTEEVDTLAEAEHARWVLERLESGWHPGPEKDVERKLSPHLIPWDRLSTEIQNQDRSAVRKLPQLLAQVGLEVVRIASPGGKGAGVESLPGSPQG